MVTPLMMTLEHSYTVVERLSHKYFVVAIVVNVCKKGGKSPSLYDFVCFCVLFLHSCCDLQFPGHHLFFINYFKIFQFPGHHTYFRNDLTRMLAVEIGHVPSPYRALLINNYNEHHYYKI